MLCVWQHIYVYTLNTKILLKWQLQQLLNLLSIVRKGQSLSRINDWRCPAYITKEKFVVSPQDPDFLIKNYELTKTVKNLTHLWMNLSQDEQDKFRKLIRWMSTPCRLLKITVNSVKFSASVLLWMQQGCSMVRFQMDNIQNYQWRCQTSSVMWVLPVSARLHTPGTAGLCLGERRRFGALQERCRLPSLGVLKLSEEHTHVEVCDCINIWWRFMLC